MRKAVFRQKDNENKEYCPSCGSKLKKKEKNCWICGADRAETDPRVLARSKLDESVLAKRIVSVSRLMKFLVGISLVCFVLAVLMILFEYVAYALGFAVLAVEYILLYCLTSDKLKKLVSFNIVKQALCEAFELEEYNPSGHIESEDVKNADLISGWNEISGSDYVRGKYRGKSISFSDLELAMVQQHVDGKGNLSKIDTTVFKGQWVICELGKTIPHALRLKENAEKLFSKAGYRKSSSTVKTENEAFNNQFQILAEDEHTALYVLTPHFMEYIMAADRKAKGRTYMCFSGDRVQLALATGRDLFKFKSRVMNLSDIEELQKRMRSEVKYLTDIIDELMLNKYLFGKEE